MSALITKTDETPPERLTLKQRIKRYLPPGVRKFLYWQKVGLIERLFRITGWQLDHLPGGIEESFHYLFDRLDFTPERVIEGYLHGIFPSPIHVTGEMRWHDPDPRGIIPVTGYHISRTLRRLINQGRFEVRVDTDCRAIIEGCAESAPGRETTYLVSSVIDMYMKLFEMGLLHCVGTWQDGKLVGGLFGVTIGSYYSGTSQFHRVPDAGKVAFAHHLRILEAGGFTLHDTWWGNEYIARFGGITIPRAEFKRQLVHAVIKPALYHPPGVCTTDTLAQLAAARQQAANTLPPASAGEPDQPVPG